MALLSLELPPILSQFKLRAPQVIRGEGRTTIQLLRYPPSYILQDETGDEVLAAWNGWWNSTRWAENPMIPRLKWNSSSRFGDVWQHFGEAAEVPSGQPYVFCFNCGLTLQHPAGAKVIGTKHLLNHLNTKGCQNTPASVHIRPPTPSILSSQQRNRSLPTSVPSYTTLAFEQELVRVVIDNNWSFRTLDRPSFQRFLQFLRPDTARISRYKFVEVFQTQLKEAKAAIFNDLGLTTKISIALDAWSASNHLSFLAIKVYYINNHWQLQEKLLDFIPLRGQHTGASIALSVLQVLSETHTKPRLLAITCDNASNNATLTRTLQTTLEDEHISWNSNENTIPCLAHVINLVVQDIIQNLQLAASTDIDAEEPLQRRHVQEINNQISVPNSLRKLRAICIAIDVSPQRFERFIATQQHLPAKDRLTVIRDVKTRWNSTYDMCARAIKIRQYIDEWLRLEVALKLRTSRAIVPGDPNTMEIDFRDIKKLQLSHTEWHHLELITRLLEQFKDATSFLSQNQKPQIQYIWLMYDKLFDFLDNMTIELDEELENQEATEWPDVVQNAAQRGRAKLTKYYAKTDDERGFLFNCATVLDPTTKLTIYEEEGWQVQDKHMYRQKFLDYLDRYDNSERTESTPGSSSFTRRLLGNEWFRKPVPQPQLRSSSFSTPDNSFNQETEEDSGPTRTEGEQYLSIPCVIRTDSYNILEWWQSNEGTYPRLAQVAKDILAIPIAGVGVERVFNVAKDVIGDRRHRLAAQTIQQIMVYRDTISSREQSKVLDTGLRVDGMRCEEIEDLFELQAPVKDVPITKERSVEPEELVEEASPLQARKRRAAEALERRELPKRERRRPERLRLSESPL